MSNSLRNVASVIVSNAKAALKLGQAEGNAREAVALGLYTFSLGMTLDDAAKAWGAEQRESITKKCGADESLLKSAKDIFKVRLSEAKKMIEAHAAGNEVATKYFTFDGETHAPVDGVTATDVLNSLKTAKVEKVEGEKGEGDNGETDTALTLDGFRAGLAGLVAGAKKAGILADALAVMLEVAQDATK